MEADVRPIGFMQRIVDGVKHVQHPAFVLERAPVNFFLPAIVALDKVRPLDRPVRLAFGEQLVNPALPDLM
jgi:hypothetical protein